MSNEVKAELVEAIEQAKALTARSVYGVRFLEGNKSAIDGHKIGHYLSALVEGDKSFERSLAGGFYYYESEVALQVGDLAILYDMQGKGSLARFDSNRMALVLVCEAGCENLPGTYEVRNSRKIIARMDIGNAFKQERLAFQQKKLMDEMEKRYREIKDVKLFAELAEHDPRMADLFKQYNSILAESGPMLEGK